MVKLNVKLRLTFFVCFSSILLLLGGKKMNKKLMKIHEYLIGKGADEETVLQWDSALFIYLWRLWNMPIEIKKEKMGKTTLNTHQEF